MEKKNIRIILTVIMVVSVFTAAILNIASEPLNTPATTEPTEEIQIEELQQWVYEQGYNYTVAENWITRLSQEDRKALCGYKHLKAPIEPLTENISFISDVQKTKLETKIGSLPPSYDAMALGNVTPVKNQGACGSCWIFGAVADFESDVLINESKELNFSEQEVGDCNIWSRVGGYNFCNGGNDLMTTNYFAIYGSANESCHPYAAIPQSCQNCTLLKNVNNWRIITGSGGESQITTIKNAILTYGPVYSTIYASGPGFHSYAGGVYEYWGTDSPNHAVEIIGWDDSLGAWLIKNSWGTGWGAHGPYPGCAWVAYGAANLGDDTSAIAGYKNPGGIIFYHDECGWMGYCLGCGSLTAYGAVRFIPFQNLTLTAVDFWAVDANMAYEIKIFDTLNTVDNKYTFSNQLGTTQTGTTNEQGYYSIQLNTPVQLVSGDDFIVQVKLTTTGWGYPIPIDYCTASWLNWLTIAKSSGESYASCDGSQFEKYGTGGRDIGIRARAQEAHTPPLATITINNASVSPGGSSTTPIMMNITDPTGLAAATINLTYDPSVCVVTNVVKGPSSFDSFTPNLGTNTSGYVRMVAFQTGGTGVGPGLVKFADITLKAVGSFGEESTLNLSIETLKNNSGVSVEYTVINGTFTVGEGTSPNVTNATATPQIIPDDTDYEPRWGEISTLNVTVTDVSNITSVTINLSSIGGSAKQPMTNIGGNIWSVTTNASIGTARWNGTAYVPHSFQVNATDEYGNSNTSVSINLTVMKNGDVSKDGDMDAWDCTYLARHLAWIPGYGTMHDEVAEVSGDGEVDAWDCTYLARHLAWIPGYERLR